MKSTQQENQNWESSSAYQQLQYFLEGKNHYI